LGSLSPKMASRWTPTRSKLSQKIHHLGIYTNCKAKFLCHFVPKYATRAHGFLLLLRHDIPFRWDEHAQTTFDDLKSTLSNAPLIIPPDYDSDYILYLSTSSISVTGVLIQLWDDGRVHVIYYISKNLLGPPLKYNHHAKLALIVFLAVQK
jgi:hypothetical protein